MRIAFKVGLEFSIKQIICFEVNLVFLKRFSMIYPRKPHMFDISRILSYNEMLIIK